VVFRIVMWIVMIVGGIVGGFWLDRLLFPTLDTNRWFHLTTLIFGLALLKIVLTVSRNTGRTLARFGREGDIPRMETNVLVTDGLYALMRHPMHLGLLFFPMTLALIVGSPSFILIIAPLEMLLMVVMIKTLEESEAITKFGDAYREYRKTVPMFCVSIACIKALLAPVEPNNRNMSIGRM